MRKCTKWVYKLFSYVQHETTTNFSEKMSHRIMPCTEKV